MGIEGEDCYDSTDITIQKAVQGSPNQLFYMEEGSDEIISLMCPNLVIAENLEPSSAPSMMPSTTQGPSSSQSPTLLVSFLPCQT